MAAKTQTERSAETAEKRRRLGEEELRHRVRPGTRAMLEELMQWHDLEQMAEAIQLLIMNTHALGPEGSAALLAVPRHEFTIPESVARKLHSEGARQAQRLDHAEQ